MNDIKLTDTLLKQIANHLSTRKTCKGVEYIVHINDYGCINFYPEVKVFPDVHHRKSVNKQNLIEHILIYHLAENHHIPINFVAGTYKYKLSATQKSRRWIKL